MYSGLYGAASGLESATQRHLVASDNLAHMQAPGYLRRVQPHSNFADHLSGTHAQQLGSIPDKTLIDFTPGVMEQTGRPLDIAITGEGFFVVNGPDGELFTRNGSFHADSEGRLITVDGLLVQGRGGDIRIPPDSNTEAVAVTSDGRLLVDGTEIGQLDLAMFEDQSLLNPAGVSLFSAPPEATRADYEPSVRQGFVENSNVTPMTELINIISASRFYEASQRVMQTISETSRQYVNNRS